MNTLDLSSFPPPPPPQKNRNPAHESMTRLIIGFKPQHFEVRVWRSETSPFSRGDNSDLYDAAAALSKIVLKDTALEVVAETVGNMDRVAAVEVLRGSTGCGIIYYPDWS